MPGLWRAGACKRLIVSVPTAPLIPPLPAEDALPPLSHFRACAACRSIRLRRGSAVRSSPPAARCLGAAARRPRGGDGRVERRRGGRLFEAIENDTLVVTEMLAEGREDFLKSPILVTFLSPVRCVLLSVCTDNSPFAVLREGC